MLIGECAEAFLIYCGEILLHVCAAIENPQSWFKMRDLNLSGVSSELFSVSESKLWIHFLTRFAYVVAHHRRQSLYDGRCDKAIRPF